MSYLREIVINAPLVNVWSLWTNQADIKEWLAPRANIMFEEGGSYEFFWDEDPESDSTLGCKLLTIEPGKLLTFQWQGKTEFLPMFRPPHAPTEVEVRFSVGADGVTHVTVEQTETRDLPDWQAYDEWMGEAWAYALTQLKATCEARQTTQDSSCC